MTNLDININTRLGEFKLGLEQKLAADGITALFGPSGCGKTTLLRIIAGLERHDGCRISFGGESWQSRDGKDFTPPHMRGVGYVFQDTRLFPHLSVLGNLEFAEKRSREFTGSIDLDGVIAALDLGELLKRRTGSLSGGEKQRVAIGRALLTRPRLLLLDEPLAALDRKRKADIIPYIEQLPARFGVPVIHVTHAIDEVTRLADNILVLEQGRKIAYGPVTDVLELQEVQSVVGHFEAGVAVEAVVAEHNQQFRLTKFDCGGALITMPYADLPIGAHVRLRVRARDVALALEKPKKTSIRNILPGCITNIISEQNTAFAEVMIDIGGAHLRSRITRASAHDLELEEGKEIFVLLKTVSFDRRSLPRGKAGWLK